MGLCEICVDPFEMANRLNEIMNHLYPSSKEKWREEEWEKFFHEMEYRQCLLEEEYMKNCKCNLIP